MPATPFWVRAGLLTIFVLFVAGVSSAQKGKEPAPRFYAKTTAGETFTNESVKGKVVLFEFWTTWCPYCAEEASLVDDHRPRWEGRSRAARRWWEAIAAAESCAGRNLRS